MGAANANWPQAARENDNSTAAEHSPNNTACRVAGQNRLEMTYWSEISAGSTMNAPKTFGSLKVPRARS